MSQTTQSVSAATKDLGSHHISDDLLDGVVVTKSMSMTDMKNKMSVLEGENAKLKKQITHFRRNNRNIKKKYDEQQIVNQKLELQVACEKNLNEHLVDVIRRLRNGSE